MKAIAASISGVEVCAPKPPGMIKTSRFFGGSANVCVGTIDCAKLEPAGNCKAAVGGLVVTGSSADAIIDSVMLCLRASVFKISSGPNASSALHMVSLSNIYMICYDTHWKPVKTRIPKFVTAR